MDNAQLGHFITKFSSLVGDDPESAKCYNLSFFIGTYVYLHTQYTPYGKINKCNA